MDKTEPNDGRGQNSSHPSPEIARACQSKSVRLGDKITETGRKPLSMGEKLDVGEYAMKRWIWIIALCFTMPAMAGACRIGEQTAAGYENASVSHAYEHWQQGGNSPIPFTFLDVRTPEEYATGHIRGARLIPVQELAGHMNDIPGDKRVYVYCHSGRRSSRAATLLAKYGFSNIENVVGGIVAWKKAGYPVQSK